MILMECDGCHTQWESTEKQPDERCPECAGTTVHQKVTDGAVSRMRGLLGTRKTTPERLKAAFAAFNTGGEAFADTVRARAVDSGRRSPIAKKEPGGVISRLFSQLSGLQLLTCREGQKQQKGFEFIGADVAGWDSIPVAIHWAGHAALVGWQIAAPGVDGGTAAL